jgi:hypothetical protein
VAELKIGLCDEEFKGKEDIVFYPIDDTIGSVVWADSISKGQMGGEIVLYAGKHHQTERPLGRPTAMV